MYSMDESPYPTRVREISVQYEKAVAVTWLRDLGRLNHYINVIGYNEQKFNRCAPIFNELRVASAEKWVQ